MLKTEKSKFKWGKSESWLKDSGLSFDLDSRLKLQFNYTNLHSHHMAQQTLHDKIWVFSLFRPQSMIQSQGWTPISHPEFHCLRFVHLKKYKFLLYFIKNNLLPKSRTLLFIVTAIRPYIGPGSVPATVFHVLSLNISVLVLSLPPVTMRNWQLNVTFKHT